MNALITPPQLAAQLHTDAPTIVLDCRNSLSDPQAGLAEFNADHIPGAHHLDLARDLSGPVAEHGGRHPLPDFNDLAQTLAGLGANNDSLFVVYDASNGAFACRAWWLLRHGGIDKVSVLNGGWPAWQAHKLPTEQGAASLPEQPGNITLTPGQMPTINHADLLAKWSSLQLVDSRETARYLGTTEPIDPIAGHIPGARNLPWQGAIADSGEFKSADAQIQRWQQAGLQDADHNTVLYCGSGVTACVNVFALALAGKSARLYPGSWSDWCSYVDNSQSPNSNRQARVATG